VSPEKCTHVALRAHKARPRVRFSLTSKQNIPKRDLYGCTSSPQKDKMGNWYCGKVRRLMLTVKEIKIAQPEACEKYFKCKEDHRSYRRNFLQKSGLYGIKAFDLCDTGASL